MNFQVKCPYCATAASVPIDPNNSGISLILCDSDAGGCDEYFAVQLFIDVNATTYKLTKARK